MLKQWSDALLRLLLLDREGAAELLEIGPILPQGQSPLGLLALAPSRVRCRDGLMREVRIVIRK